MSWLRSAPPTMLGVALFSWRRPWNCCVKAAPHSSWKPRYGAPSGLGGSNCARLRASWGRKFDSVTLRSRARGVTGGAAGLAAIAVSGADDSCAAAGGARLATTAVATAHRTTTRSILWMPAYMLDSFLLGAHGRRAGCPAPGNQQQPVPNRDVVADAQRAKHHRRRLDAVSAHAEPF